MEGTDVVESLLAGLEVNLEEELKGAESTRTNFGYGEDFHEEIERLASRHGVHKKDILDMAVLLLREVFRRREARGAVIEKIKERSTSDPVRKSYAISSNTRSKALEMANQLELSRKHLVGVGISLVKVYADVRGEAWQP